MAQELPVNEKCFSHILTIQFIQKDIFLDFWKETPDTYRCINYIFFLCEYNCLFHLQGFQRLDIFDSSCEYSDHLLAKLKKSQEQSLKLPQY